MLYPWTVKEILDSCDGFITIYTTGTDGGGMSTYGLTFTINDESTWECNDWYLKISKTTKERSNTGSTYLHYKRDIFIPYDQIVSIQSCKRVD